MSLTDELAKSALDVEQARGHIETLRTALDKTDAFLGATEEGIAKAGVAVERTRRWAPRVAVVAVAVTVVVVALVVVRRSRLTPSDDGNG